MSEKRKSSILSFIINIFTNNIGIKILSVILAVFLWFYAMSFSSPVSQRVFSAIPIEIDNISENLSVYDDYNGTIDITCSGKRNDLSKYSSEDFKATVEINDNTPIGKQALSVSLSIPNGLTVKDQTISTVYLYIDTKSETSVPITVDLSNSGYTLDKGLEIDKSLITTSVTSVNVSGPQNIINTIDHAQITLSELGNVKNSVSVNSEFILVDSGGNEVTSPYIKCDTNTVNVNIPVLTEKTVKLTASYKYGYFNSDTVDVGIYPETIKIKGDVETLNDLDEISVITIDEKHTYSNDISTSITLPEGVTSADGVTNALISISYKDSTTKEIKLSEISDINSPNNINYRVLTSTFNILLRGPKDKISAIEAKDITLSADLSEITAEGSYEVPLTINISDTYKNDIYEIGDYTASIYVY